MEGFTRAIGSISLVSGALLIVSPDTAKRLMKVRAEFTQLSSGALRLLGVWYFLTGLLMVGVTTRRAAEIGEITRPEELRKAA